MSGLPAQSQATAHHLFQSMFLRISRCMMLHTKHNSVGILTIRLFASAVLPAMLMKPQQQ